MATQKSSTDSLEDVRMLCEQSVVPGGNETVLLVEDDGDVRRLLELLLQHLGYHVLSAGSGAVALKVAAEHRGPIDLLLTDVVMPDILGWQVTEGLRRQHPEVKVLYITGYAEDAIVRLGPLKSETAVLQKPFTHIALAVKLREMLG
jgi:CheY-like chemotaxis protein